MTKSLIEKLSNMMSKLDDITVTLHQKCLYFGIAFKICRLPYLAVAITYATFCDFLLIYRNISHELIVIFRNLEREPILLRNYLFS